MQFLSLCLEERFPNKTVDVNENITHAGFVHNLLDVNRQLLVRKLGNYMAFGEHIAYLWPEWNH